MRVSKGKPNPVPNLFTCLFVLLVYSKKVLVE